MDSVNQALALLSRSKFRRGHSRDSRKARQSQHHRAMLARLIVSPAAALPQLPGMRWTFLPQFLRLQGLEEMSLRAMLRPVPRPAVQPTPPPLIHLIGAAPEMALTQCLQL